MKAIIISILFLGMHAQAQMKTPFDTLRDAFINSTEPAKIHDFDEGTWDHCVFSDIANPMMTRNTKVRTLQYMSQGNGPLFPGNGDYRIDVFNDSTLNNNLGSFFQHSVVQEGQTELKQIIDGSPWRRMNIYGRVNQSKEPLLLFFVETSNYYGPMAPMYPWVYGYCWNNSSNKDDGSGEQPLPIPPNPH
jgi:hypothetical protein